MFCSRILQKIRFHWILNRYLRQWSSCVLILYSVSFHVMDYFFSVVASHCSTSSPVDFFKLSLHMFKATESGKNASLSTVSYKCVQACQQHFKGTTYDCFSEIPEKSGLWPFMWSTTFWSFLFYPCVQSSSSLMETSVWTSVSLLLRSSQQTTLNHTTR